MRAGLSLVGGLPLLLIACERAAGVACGGDLTTAQQSLRESLGYTPRSSDEHRCSACQFFSAQGESACGRCAILNGSVHPDGRCSSWSARA